jgi:hypothetical protein
MSLRMDGYLFQSILERSVGSILHALFSPVNKIHHPTVHPSFSTGGSISMRAEWKRGASQRACVCVSGEPTLGISSTNSACRRVVTTDHTASAVAQTRRVEARVRPAALCNSVICAANATLTLGAHDGRSAWSATRPTYTVQIGRRMRETVASARRITAPRDHVEELPRT